MSISNTDWSIVDGNIHSDERGLLAYNNLLNIEKIKRYYLITSTKDRVVRAWQGHKEEWKYFTVIQGSFIINLIKPDQWKNPAKDLAIDTIELSCERNQTLIVPGGYVNGIINTLPNSKLLVFSDATLETTIKDDYRFDKDYWGIYNKL